MKVSFLSVLLAFKNLFCGFVYMLYKLIKVNTAVLVQINFI